MTRRAGLEVVARLADRDFAVELEVAAGEVLAVLGPNGAGKSTLLEVVAGLVRPDTGVVRLDGRTLTDTAKGVALPPHRRGISLLAQDSLLFPHLTVAQNVAFGPRSRGARGGAARAVAREWLTAVDALEFADRKPGQLSGGQAQRVALARALAVDPQLILLDEPMAALDVAVAPAMRALLRGVLRHPSPGDSTDKPVRTVSSTRSAILVTHDIIDALTLADRLVVIESGRIVESGPVATVLARPRSAFAARIAGVNLILGTAVRGTGSVRGLGDEPGDASGTAHTRLAERDPRSDRRRSSVSEVETGSTVGAVLPVAGAPSASGEAGMRGVGSLGTAALGNRVTGAISTDGIEVHGQVDGDWTPGAPSAAVFSPASVAVHREPPEGSPRNIFRVRIAEITDRGGIIRVRGGDRPDGSAGLAADLTPAAVAELALAPGDAVYLAVKATEVQIYSC